MSIRILESVHQLECTVPFISGCWDMSIIVNKIYENQISRDTI